MAGFDPESVAVGSDGRILIAPDREQVAENADTHPRRRAGVRSSPGTRRWPGRASSSPSSRCCRPRRIVPRQPMFRASCWPHFDQRAKRGDRVARLVPSDRASDPGYGPSPVAAPRRGVVNHRFLTPRGEACQEVRQVVVDPDVVRVALRGRPRARRRPPPAHRPLSAPRPAGECWRAAARRLADPETGPDGLSLFSDLRAFDQRGAGCDRRRSRSAPATASGRCRRSAGCSSLRRTSDQLSR